MYGKHYTTRRCNYEGDINGNGRRRPRLTEYVQANLGADQELTWSIVSSGERRTFLS